MANLKILIVDDSAIYRKILTEAVNSTGIAIAHQTASNGLIALERLKIDTFDAVLLDVNMPEMDGMEALTVILKYYPKMPVIMISSSTGKSATITLKALELGAIDFILKPLEQNYDTNMEIIKNQLKILFSQLKINSLNNNSKLKETREPTLAANSEKTKIAGVDLLVIASSTGGPNALEKIFSSLGNDFIKPTLVVQHMPPEFTKVLAESLNKKKGIAVKEAADGDIIRAGRAIVAQGGLHMCLDKGEGSNRIIRLENSEHVNGVRPAADVLFKSVAKVYENSRILAVILTGMGADGMAGIKELKKKCNCYCIAQSERTCTVYGMPRAVVEAGYSDEILDIDNIASRIKEIIANGS